MRKENNNVDTNTIIFWFGFFQTSVVIVGIIFLLITGSSSPTAHLITSSLILAAANKRLALPSCILSIDRFQSNSTAKRWTRRENLLTLPAAVRRMNCLWEFLTPPFLRLAFLARSPAARRKQRDLNAGNQKTMIMCDLRTRSVPCLWKRQRNILSSRVFHSHLGWKLGTRPVCLRGFKRCKKGCRRAVES